MIRAIRIAIALMMSICATSLPATAATTPSEPAPAATAPDYVLGPGDRLRLSLYDDATFSGEFTISDNGTVSLPLIGAQPAAGMTLAAFSEAIQTKLADGYYRNPRVSAEIANFRPFYILGEVNKPGQYPYVAGLTLGEAVAIANGYTYAARKGLVGIRRAKTSEEVKVPATAAMPIGPGDTVRVLERLF